MIVMSTLLAISSSVRDIERLLRESPPFRAGRMSILDPQWTLPGCQRIQEDVQPQRQEFPIRINGENGDLR
jgi:hypothetical protein